MSTTLMGDLWAGGWTLRLMATLMLVAGCQPQVEEGERFDSLGGIKQWQAINNRTLVLLGNNGRWYRAELTRYCPDIDFTADLNFITRQRRGGVYLVAIEEEGQLCDVARVTLSSGPPLPSAFIRDPR